MSSRLPAISFRLRTDRQGFSLLELLVVVSLLAAVAFVATGTYIGVHEQANGRLVRAEIQQIAQAVRQFKQDTGYYPGQGPFALSSVPANSGPDCPGMPAGDGGVDRDFIVDSVAGFRSPANLRQLFEPPVLCDNHPLAHLDSWNTESGRGWNGPYLENNLEYTDIGDGMGIDGSGDMVTVNASRLENLRGVADPFEHTPVRVNSGARCEENAANSTPCLLDWRPLPGDQAFLKHGRPYLYFIDEAAEYDETNGNGIQGCLNAPCLVSAGPNGDYDQGNIDDIVLNIE